LRKSKTRVIELDKKGVNEFGEVTSILLKRYLPHKITKKLMRIPVPNKIIASPFNAFLCKNIPTKYTAKPIKNPIPIFQKEGILFHTRLNKNTTPKKIKIAPILARRFVLKKDLIAVIKADFSICHPILSEVFDVGISCSAFSFPISCCSIFSSLSMIACCLVSFVKEVLRKFFGKKIPFMANPSPTEIIIPIFRLIHS
jgi:hypothetical protein